LEPGKRGVGVWRLRGDEPFFTGHFPGQPVVPGVLLAEALAQVSGLVAFGNAEQTSQPARLAQVNVKFQAGVEPPAEVVLQSVLTKELSGLYLFDVRARVGDVAAASGTLVLAKAPA
ncbi:MAG TPA: hypothetical protein VFF65_08810, partial [Phycisphaerales bacterium]|nr:hypothetical protein [Phycisphaerales bacterium]